MNAPVVGIAEHYGQFVKLCRVRIEQLGVTMDTVDEVAGFSRGYAAKIFCGDKAVSIDSFFTLLDTLGLRLFLEHDEAKLARLSKRESWIKLRRAGPRFRGKRGATTRIVLHRDFYRQIGRKGAAAKHSRARNFREWGRKGALARWGNR